MLDSTGINSACDLQLCCMGQVASGRASLPSGNWYDALPSGFCSIWGDIIWSIIHDAIGEPIVGAMPHAVYTMIAPDLTKASGLTQGGTEADSAFFKRALASMLPTN